MNPPQLLIEERRLPAKQVIPTRLGLHGVWFHGVDHHLELLLQLDEPLL